MSTSHPPSARATSPVDRLLRTAPGAPAGAPDEEPRTRHEEQDDFGGLHRDIGGLLGRRRALVVLAGTGLGAVLAACSSGSDSSGPSGGSTSTTGGSPSNDTTTGDATTGDTTTGDDTTGDSEGAGDPIPEETAGPFPSDGTNGPNVLTEEGVVRSDITTSVGSLSGQAGGVPMAMELTVVDASTGSPLPGAAVYAWHCTADGRYSMYEIEEQNYLRGVGVADAAGRVSFQSIYPGCYAGRWPHVHLEVFEDLDVATSGRSAVRTSQLALPEADSAEVYADPRYGNSAADMSRLSLSTDGIFADGWTDQLATVTGSVDDGLTASLLIRV